MLKYFSFSFQLILPFNIVLYISYKGYRAKNMLAAIDHNFHVSRPVKTTEDGKIQYVYIST